MSKILNVLCVLSTFTCPSFSQASADTEDKAPSFCGSIQTMTSEGIGLASGTLLGTHPGEDGSRRGIGLTVAHTFLDKDLSPLAFTGASFSTLSQYHFGVKSAPIERIFLPQDVRMEGGQGINDICLFVTGALPQDMPFKTRPLYTGVGYRAKPNLEGLIVGYGPMYRAGTTSEIKHDLTRHSGVTCTTFYSAEADFRERAVFRTFLRGTLTKKEILASRFMNGFSNTADDKLQLKLRGHDVWVFAHKDQVSFSDGCSGGPLIFNTSRGPEVAGVLSQTSLESLGVSLFKDKPLVVHTFEAVPSHPWLHTCVTQFCETGTVSAPEGIKMRTFH